MAIIELLNWAVIVALSACYLLVKVKRLLVAFVVGVAVEIVMAARIFVVRSHEDIAGLLTYVLVALVMLYWLVKVARHVSVRGRWV